jgi:hypothetical protein
VPTATRKTAVAIPGKGAGINTGIKRFILICEKFYERAFGRRVYRYNSIIHEIGIIVVVKAGASRKKSKGTDNGDDRTTTTATTKVTRLYPVSVVTLPERTRH